MEKLKSPYISNGKAKIGGKNKLGAVATYTCNKGYELHGIGTRVGNYSCIFFKLWHK